MVAAGADDVDGVRGRRDARHALPHGLGGADDLVDGLAAHLEGGEEGAGLDRRHLARQQVVEGGTGLGTVEGEAPGDLREMGSETIHGF